MSKQILLLSAVGHDDLFDRMVKEVEQRCGVLIIQALYQIRGSHKRLDDKFLSWARQKMEDSHLTILLVNDHFFASSPLSLLGQEAVLSQKALCIVVSGTKMLPVWFPRDQAMFASPATPLDPRIFDISSKYLKGQPGPFFS